MSVQLILYPQDYQGVYQYNSSVINTNLVADGVGFNTIQNHTGYSSTTSNPAFDAVTNDAPITNWKKFRSFGGTSYADVDYPIKIGTVAPKLRFKAASGGVNSSSGVYQRIDNLVVGATYQLKFRIVNAATGGFLFIGNDSYGNNLGGGGATAISTSTTGYKTFDFTAVNSSEVLILDYQNSGADYIEVRRITIRGAGATPPLVFTDLADGQVICDLYQDEDIPLSLSIDNFKNAAEKTQSYSKDFNLPATKRNNRIFTQIFEITNSTQIDGVLAQNTFNPYVQTKCILKQDGYILFEGFLRLIDIVNKEGEISYNVNLYSETIALKDVLENKKLSDLDLDELEHDYNKTNIKASWETTGLPLTNSLPVNSFAYKASLGANNTDVLKYPFVDWTGNISLTAPSGTNAVDGQPVLNRLEDAFRPFINCRYLFRKIMNDAGFTYSSDFLDGLNLSTGDVDFTKLYMDFNFTGEVPSETKQGVYNRFGQSLPDYLSATTFKNVNLSYNEYSDEMGWDDVNYKFVGQSDNSGYKIEYSVRFTCITNDTLTFRGVKKDSGGNITDIYNLTSTAYTTTVYVVESGVIFTTLDTNETFELQFRSTTAGTFKQYNSTVAPFPSTVDVTVGLTTVIDSTLLNSKRGEIGQWEYVKAFFTMFNLVSMPDPSNTRNIRIEPYNKIFFEDTAGLSLADRNIKHDWTDRVDATEIKLTPLELKKKTIFKYEEDSEDYPFTLYRNGTGGSLYGSKIFNSHLLFGFTLLTGEEEITASPFAATVIKPLFDRFPDFIVPAIFSSNDTQSAFEGFDNAPRILFDNGKKLSANSYYIPAQNGLSSENQTYFGQFTHLSEVSPTTVDTSDLNFESSQLINPVGSPFIPVNNLFNIYWQPYYNELYNADTRVMTIKVNLSPADINTFQFNEKVMIKNRLYRVNKIDYKPRDLSTVEFILIP